MFPLWLVTFLLSDLLDLVPDVVLGVPYLSAGLHILANGDFTGEAEVVASNLRNAVLLQVLCGTKDAVM